MTEAITQYSAIIIGVLGALAFFVNIVVELTKELPVIKKMPTKLWVIIVSAAVCVLGTIIYFIAKGLVLHWYYIVLSFFGAFIVAYLAMYGWDTLRELWKRYQK